MQTTLKVHRTRFASKVQKNSPSVRVPHKTFSIPSLNTSLNNSDATSTSHKSELKRLNRELEDFEFLKATAGTTNEEDLLAYRKHVEGLALLLKTKDLKFGGSLLRGLLGLLKAVDTLKENQPPVETKPKQVVLIKRTKSTQTVIEAYDVTKDLSLRELAVTIENMKKFQKQVREMKYGRINHHLTAVLNSLDSMYTDIPNQTELPEFAKMDRKHSMDPDFEESEVEESESYKKKLSFLVMLDKSEQTEEVHQQTDNRNKYLQDILKERELEIFKIKSNFKVLSTEKTKIDDSYSRTRNELSTTRQSLEVKAKECESVKEKCVQLEKAFIEQSQILEKYEVETRIAKQNEGNVRNMMMASKSSNYRMIQKLQKVENKRYASTVSSVVNREKLNQIETSWYNDKKKHYQYTNFSEGALLAAHGVLKKNYMEKYKSEANLGDNLPELVSAQSVSGHSFNSSDSAELLSKISSPSGFLNVPEIPERLKHSVQSNKTSRQSLESFIIPEDNSHLDTYNPQGSFDSVAKHKAKQNVPKIVENKVESELKHMKSNNQAKFDYKNSDSKIIQSNKKQLKQGLSSKTMNDSTHKAKLSHTTKIDKHPDLRDPRLNFPGKNDNSKQFESKIHDANRLPNLPKKEKLMRIREKDEESSKLENDFDKKERKKSQKPEEISQIITVNTEPSRLEKEQDTSLSFRTDQDYLSIQNTPKRHDRMITEEINPIRIRITKRKRQSPTQEDVYGQLKELEEKLNAYENKLKTEIPAELAETYEEILTLRPQYKSLLNTIHYTKFTQTDFPTKEKSVRTWAKVEGDTYLHSNKQTVVHKPVLVEEPSLIHEYKTDPLLISIFKPEEIDDMPVHLRFELLNAMRGHKTGKCAEFCIHMQKAMSIRRNARGIPYPIHYKNIE